MVGGSPHVGMTGQLLFSTAAFCDKVFALNFGLGEVGGGCLGEITEGCLRKVGGGCLGWGV